MEVNSYKSKKKKLYKEQVKLHNVSVAMAGCLIPGVLLYQCDWMLKYIPSLKHAIFYLFY